MQRRRTWWAPGAVMLALALAACGQAPKARPSQVPRVPPIRVGVTPNAPPYAFVRGGELVGLEVDFARQLAQAGSRPVQVLEMDWSDLIPSLQSGRIDVIMSGLSVTRAREAAIAFSDAYLQEGLLPVVRREDFESRRKPGNGFKCGHPIGVPQGTTAEKLVRERCPADAMPYMNFSDAMDELRQRRIDTVVADAPIVVWAVSQNEADYAVLLDPLDREALAWGVRRDDDATRDFLNRTLATWRTDGTRDRLLSRWIPYWREIEARAAKAPAAPR